MATIIQLRNDTAANFTTYNPVLAQGEIGIESDTKKIKVGDGVKTWTQLDYWVKPLTSEMITTALGFTPYDSSNPDGFISGITSSDVTTALGFTPYDSSNPAGYTDNVGTVTSVNNVEPVNGNVTIETIEEGGSIGQVFVKKSDTDYDVEWQSADDLRMFNKDAFTVSGTPTITDDGVLTNSDQANNYIYIPETYIAQLSTANSWKIKWCGVLQSDGNFLFHVFSNGTGFRNDTFYTIRTTDNINNFSCIFYVNNNGTKEDLPIYATLSSSYNGKKYIQSIEFTGTQYIWTYQFEGESAVVKSVDSTYKLYNYNFGDRMHIGSFSNGSIDLKQFSITVDDVEVFNGSTTLSNRLADKVDKTTTANKVYGTDAQGNQTTYDKNSFGQVDDVTVGGTSVVANKVAVLGSMAGETASDYVLVSNVVNDVVSTDTNKPLSANMGKELQDQVDNLKARGRFLALWDCSTGLAETHPTVSPYEYKAGDYFIVGIVAQEGGTNYKPSGSSYTDNVPSTAIETGAVSVNDTYYYDGNVWHLQINTQKEIAFVNIAGDPYDNSNLASALNDKQDELPSQTGQSGKFLTTNGTAISWGDAPVTDVQINSTSILSSGVANIPVGTSSVLGVYRVNPNQGISAFSSGDLCTISASEQEITAKTQSYKPIVPSKLDIAVREGLGNNTLTWTDAYKQNARNTIGATQAVFVDWSD